MPKRRPRRKTAQAIEVIARGLMTHGQFVLVCKNVKDGYYYLPGGHVEPGERIAEALAREMVEETGIACRVSVPVFVSEGLFLQGGKRRHELNLVCHMAHEKSQPQHAPPTVRSLENGIGFEWLDQAAISDTDLRPEAIKAWMICGARDEILAS